MLEAILPVEHRQLGIAEHHQVAEEHGSGLSDDAEDQRVVDMQMGQARLGAALPRRLEALAQLDAQAAHRAWVRQDGAVVAFKALVGGDLGGTG